LTKPKPKTDQAKIQRTANAIRVLKEWHDWEEKQSEVKP